jgi:hypothetical protein
MKDRKCLECGEILRGRADQKFCCDACRNAFNNKKLGKTTNYIRKVNRILKHNHAILESLNVTDQTVTDKETLANQGYNFDFHTHSNETHNGKKYCYCYDQGFASLDNNNLLLVKEKD